MSSSNEAQPSAPTPSGFEENMTPPPGLSEFIENIAPAGPQPNPKSKKNKPKPWLHTATTQRIIALSIVGITLIIYSALVLSLICHWLTEEEYVRAIAALAPLQALAAATVGFFFGQTVKRSE